MGKLIYNSCQMNVKLMSFLIVFLLAYPGNVMSDTSKINFEDAKKIYDSGEYKRAYKQFTKLADHAKDSEIVLRARLYAAKSQRQLGNIDKALSELNDLITIGIDKAQLVSEDLFEELEIVSSQGSISHLQQILQKSKIKSIRKHAAESIGKLSSKLKFPDKDKNLEFMIKQLQVEPEFEVARAISIAMAKMGDMQVSRIIDIYHSADEKFKNRLLIYISKIDDEDLIMTLQEESDRGSKNLKYKILWALAKMDPYRFASSILGRLKIEDDKYVIIDEQDVATYIKFSEGEELKDRLRVYLNRDVTLYGIEEEDGFLLTEIFESK